MTLLRTCWSSQLSAAMLCLSLGLSACSDSREPLTGAALTPRRSVAALPTEQDHESVWARYTQDLPGFAGMFYDENGDLVVLLTDTARASLARERFADRVGESHRPTTLPRLLRPASMRVQSARYDFTTLLDAKVAVGNALGGHSELLTAIGIDEKLNRVGVIASSEAALLTLRAILTKAAIASDIVSFSVEPRTSLLSGRSERSLHAVPTMSPMTGPMTSSISALIPGTNDSIQFTDARFPLVGGQRVFILGNGSCTIGVPVTWEYGVIGPLAGLVTAGHCTDSVNQRLIMISDTGSFNPDIGRVEFTGKWSYGSCGHGSDVCRHADVALIQLQNYGLSYTQGGIANPTAAYTSTGANWGTRWFWNNTAYWGIVNSGAPYGPFVVDAENSPSTEVVGQWVIKTGWHAGTGYGQITNASQDRLQAANVWIQHSVVTNTGTLEGDSGGPVWWPQYTLNGDNNPQAKLIGITWGAVGSPIAPNNYYAGSIYSPIYEVRNQLWAYNYWIFTY